jgi:hypothetical protein
MVGMEGFEPPTHGLGNACLTFHPVRTHDLSIGYSGCHIDPRPQFGHEYAPQNAPRAQPSNEEINRFLPLADCLHQAAPVLRASKRPPTERALYLIVI